MNHGLVVQHCRIVAPERLSDRFLASGVFFQKEDPCIDGQVLLIYVLEISKPWFPSSKVLPTLLEALHAQHAQLNPKYDLGDQFELMLRNLNQQLNTISEQGETDWIGNLNGLIMVASGNELHFSQTGRSPAYLLQKNRIRQISDDTALENEPHPLKTFANLASGALQPDDYILVSNQELYNEISLDALRRVMNNNSPAIACQSIVRELKKDKNIAVSSIILKIGDKANPDHKRFPEVTEIILEEEMQSTFKKIQKKVTPWLQVTKKHSATLGRAGLKAARTTGTLMKEKVAPTASSLIHKGAEQAAQLKDQVSSQLASNKEPVVTQEETPVVEIIPPKAEREAAKLEMTTTEGLALNSANPRPLTPAKPIWQTAIPTLKKWFSKSKNKRMAALGAAVLIIAFTALTVISRRPGSETTSTPSEIETQLAKASELEDKAVTAHKLSQDIEAAREVKEAQEILNALSNLSDEQKSQSDSIWKDLNSIADTLSTTTRFSKAAGEYAFSSSSSQVMASLPFFYGFSSSSNGLLQTGKGELTSVQKTIKLPETSDSIVSVVKSSESDTTGYALAKSNKVYRIVQSGNSTTLLAISPESGDFAPGDAISTYNGHVYILDGKSGLLWKYTSSGTTYSKGASVIDTTKYDIKKGVSLAIDGSIYVLKQDGSLLKFTSGKQETDFQLKNIPTLSQPLIHPIQVITSEEMDNIYLLDAGISSGTRSSVKVLVFKKDGSFVRQYALPESYLQVQGFDVDPAAKKLWILSDKKVSEFDL